VTSRLLLRGGCVLTMGAKASNLTEGDVLIDGAEIAEVGRSIHARDAEVVDATDTIVMPGFVDTHRHAWTSLFRNLGESDEGSASVGVASHYGVDDVYAGTLVGLLGAAEAGITTVVDWCELPLEDDGADALVRAHDDSGLRTVLVLAGPGWSGRERLVWLAERAGETTTVAFGSVRTEPDQVAEDWALARAMGLRVHVHAGEGAPGPGWVRELASLGLLGDDVTMIHRSAIDAADVEAIASSGAGVSLSPSSEMATGLGVPPIQELMDHDVRPGLGIDLERLAPGDMFAQMRQTISLQHATVFDRKLRGKGSLPRLMSTRDVVRAATVEGARVAGLRGVTGSLEPGMAADVIVLRTDRPNIWPVNDPIGAVVWGMDTSNIDRVVVGGRTIVADGTLEADVGEVRAIALLARERVATASGLASSSGSRR